MVFAKLFHCLLIFGVVVCQNGDFNPSMEGSGSGEVDAGSTVNATFITKIITEKPEDTTSEPGSGDDEDGRISTSLKPTTTKLITTRLSTAARPIIDEEEGSGAGSGGSGDSISTVSPIPTIYTERVETNMENILPIEFQTAKMQTTQSGVMPDGLTTAKAVSLKTTMKIKTTSGSYLSSKASETEKPLTKGTTNEADPVTDIEVINSPTSIPKSSTEKKPATTSNDIKEPTQDPDLLGNTAKSSGNNGASKPAISFTTGIIIGVVVGALLAVLVILVLVYRLRKKDEGSYSLEEPITGYTKQEPGSPVSGKEYFA